MYLRGQSRDGRRLGTGAYILAGDEGHSGSVECTNRCVSRQSASSRSHRQICWSIPKRDGPIQVKDVERKYRVQSWRESHLERPRGPFELADWFQAVSSLPFARHKDPNALEDASQSEGHGVGGEVSKERRGRSKDIQGEARRRADRRGQGAKTQRRSFQVQVSLKSTTT